MSLITIERQGVTYYVNSNVTMANEFTDADGNKAYQIYLDGKDIQLTKAEYDQIKNNEENTGIE